jgi:hypothetical protein
MKGTNIVSWISIVLFILLFSTPGRSQILISILLGDKLNSGAIEFGITGGLNRTHMFPMKETTGLNNFNLGFYFDFRLKKDLPLYIYTGCLIKSEMGASNISVYSLDDPNFDSLMADGYINRIIPYFNVPVTVKYRFKNNIFVLGGAQLGLMNRAVDEFTNEINNKDDIIYKEYTKKQYNRIDAGATIGAGYKFKYGAMMNIGIRYYYGLTNVYKDDFKIEYGHTTNSSLYIFAEIPIGAERKTRPPKEKNKKNK